MINYTSYPSCVNIIKPYVYNLTSSYIDQSNEVTLIATSVVMFSLAALFFNLNLFSRNSDVSAILNPSVRLFLSTSLTLFLPVMSYLFSEAKNHQDDMGVPYSSGILPSTPSSGKPSYTELPLRARIILMWMLLVELLRKKVEAVMDTAGMQGYSRTIDRTARIAWLGYLVFFSLHSTGKRAIYGILWMVAYAKLVQRVVTSELGKRSFAYGKNAPLLSSYMAQILVLQQADQEQHMHAAGDGGNGEDLLKRCKYAVMGEEELKTKVGPEGYHVELKETAVVTVGDIWKLAETDRLLQGDPKLKRLCLSFALYKLLRRRLEDFPITDAETRDCRDLIFHGLCRDKDHEEAAATSTQQQQDVVAAVALFQVLSDELQFVCEYYHSVLPVVLANPFFYLLNYIMFPIVILAMCTLTIILCSNGDVLYGFHSIKYDNYTVSAGIFRMIGCLLVKTISSRSLTSLGGVIFSVIDVFITLLLMLAFFFEEVWECIVFLFSNWFMVSLLCNYTSKPQWRDNPLLSGTIRHLLWARNLISHPNLCFKQFSVLSFHRLSSLALPTVAVPKEVKTSVTHFLVAHVDDVQGRLSNGWSTLHRLGQSKLLWACQNDNIAEVILTWHIATGLFGVKYPEQKKTQTTTSPAGCDNRKVATALCRYCAYLVAFYPALLPADKDGTEYVYKEMDMELKKELGCWKYYTSPHRVRYDKLMEIAGRRQEAPVAEIAGRQEEAQAAETVLQKGARLGKILIDEGKEGKEGDVWKILADLWTELVVYTAPSSGEAKVKAHREALALGGEFVTVLWALATHTGIARPDVAPWKEARAARVLEALRTCRAECAC